MNVYQVSVNYVNEEDRLLAPINTREGQELRFWLTRRLSLAVMPMLEQAAHIQLGLLAPTGSLPAGTSAPGAVVSTPLVDAHTKRTLANFQKEAIWQNADFTTPYAQQPLVGQTDVAPLLVTELSLNNLASGQLEVRLAEKLADQSRQIQLVADAPLAQGLLHLLRQALKQSQWLEPANPALANGYQNSDQALNDIAENDFASYHDKPEYLN